MTNYNRAYMEVDGKCGYMNSTIIVFALITSIFGILLTTSSAYAITYAATMNKATSGGSLNVMVQPTPTPIVKGTQTNFTVSFEQKGGYVVQPHIDYDVTITKDGKRVFQASALGGGIVTGTSKTAHPNQPLHATTGIITMPYTFPKQGDYIMNVTVYGILFNPIDPEYAQFPINVS
ncbi:MAG: hypothetical protein WBZ36_30735 [Candidatus Nitrosopolaris sp.]